MRPLVNSEDQTWPVMFRGHVDTSAVHLRQALYIGGRDKGRDGGMIPILSRDPSKPSPWDARAYPAARPTAFTCKISPLRGSRREIRRQAGQRLDSASARESNRGVCSVFWL